MGTFLHYVALRIDLVDFDKRLFHKQRQGDPQQAHVCFCAFLPCSLVARKEHKFSISFVAQHSTVNRHRLGTER